MNSRAEHLHTEFTGWTFLNSRAEQIWNEELNNFCTGCIFRLSRAEPFYLNSRATQISGNSRASQSFGNSLAGVFVAGGLQIRRGTANTEWDWVFFMDWRFMIAAHRNTLFEPDYTEIASLFFPFRLLEDLNCQQNFILMIAGWRDRVIFFGGYYSSMTQKY